ncbi:MAG: hypothetical protein ACKVKX_07425 [Pseudomonadales bacterium]
MKSADRGGDVDDRPILPSASPLANHGSSRSSTNRRLWTDVRAP